MGTFLTNPTKKGGGVYEMFTTKETCLHSLNFVYCFTGCTGRGLIIHVCSMCFKIMSKVVRLKYTCRLRRYNYTYDKLNTRHFIIIFFLRGGAQNLSLPPGASYVLSPLNRDRDWFTLLDHLLSKVKKKIVLLHPQPCTIM